MKRIAFACVLVASLLCNGHGWESREEPMYSGLSASQWESEIRRWEPLAFTGGKHRYSTLWAREPAIWESGLQRVGIRAAQRNCKMPLLQSDPEAVPVLVELLRSPNRQARLLALEGLGKVGGGEPVATPLLLRLMEEKDREVAGRAEHLLFWTDQAAAEQVGLKWTGLCGLVREGRTTETDRDSLPVRKRHASSSTKAKE